MDNDDVSVAGLLSNTLPDFEFAFVAVSDTFVVTHRGHDPRAKFQALVQDILDTIGLIETDTIMDNDDVSVAGFLSNTLPDFEFTFVAVSDTFVVTDRGHDPWAKFQALVQDILDASNLLGSSMNGAAP